MSNRASTLFAIEVVLDVAVSKAQLANSGAGLLEDLVLVSVVVEYQACVVLCPVAGRGRGGRPIRRSSIPECTRRTKIAGRVWFSRVLIDLLHSKSHRSQLWERPSTGSHCSCWAGFVPVSPSARTVWRQALVLR